MNPNLQQLNPYPFEKLAKLLGNLSGKSSLNPINLSIGEPKHPTPKFIQDAYIENLNSIGKYPTTSGSLELRNCLSKWIRNRFRLNHVDETREVLPVNGTREALFSFAQVINGNSTPKSIVVSPNPFYQIYEGAAYLSGAETRLLNLTSENEYRLAFDQINKSEWKRTSLCYMCSPSNPTGHVISMDEWEQLFKLSDEYGFVIAADECYSEIYIDESKPPVGVLEAANKLGIKDFARIMAFGSLSKRSNVPGMRSGFVAGDKELIGQFLRYRTYHGSAMSLAVQSASIAAWSDELHVQENREKYKEKFNMAVEQLEQYFDIDVPAGGFYLWLKTPISDVDFAEMLYRDYNVTVLPGSYLGRVSNGLNPGANRVRIALVGELDECREAIERIIDLCAII